MWRTITAASRSFWSACWTSEPTSRSPTIDKMSCKWMSLKCEWAFYKEDAYREFLQFTDVKSWTMRFSSFLLSRLLKLSLICLFFCCSWHIPRPLACLSSCCVKTLSLTSHDDRSENSSNPWQHFDPDDLHYCKKMFLLRDNVKMFCL